MDTNTKTWSKSKTDKEGTQKRKQKNLKHVLALTVLVIHTK